PAQVPFNRPLPRILSAAGIPFTILSGPDNPREIGDAISSAYENRSPHVILVPPGCIGENTCTAGCAVPRAPRPSKVCYERNWRAPLMTRFDAIRTIASRVEEEVLVSNIGVPSKELYAARTGPEISTCWEVTPRLRQSGLALPRSGRRSGLLCWTATEA